MNKNDKQYIQLQQFANIQDQSKMKAFDFAFQKLDHVFEAIQGLCPSSPTFLPYIVKAAKLINEGLHVDQKKYQYISELVLLTMDKSNKEELRYNIKPKDLKILGDFEVKHREREQKELMEKIKFTNFEQNYENQNLDSDQINIADIAVLENRAQVLRQQGQDYLMRQEMQQPNCWDKTKQLATQTCKITVQYAQDFKGNVQVCCNQIMACCNEDTKKKIVAGTIIILLTGNVFQLINARNNKIEFEGQISDLKNKNSELMDNIQFYEQCNQTQKQTEMQGQKMINDLENKLQNCQNQNQVLNQTNQMQSQQMINDSKTSKSREELCMTNLTSTTKQLEQVLKEIKALNQTMQELNHTTITLEAKVKLLEDRKQCLTKEAVELIYNIPDFSATISWATHQGGINNVAYNNLIRKKEQLDSQFMDMASQYGCEDVWQFIKKHGDDYHEKNQTQLQNIMCPANEGKPTNLTQPGEVFCGDFNYKKGRLLQQQGSYTTQHEGKIPATKPKKVNQQQHTDKFLAQKDGGNQVNKYEHISCL